MTTADVEGNSRSSTHPVVENPYAADNHPTAAAIADKLPRLVYMGITTFVLHRFFNFFRVLFKSPNIRHEWFQIGLACTIGTCMRVLPQE